MVRSSTVEFMRNRKAQNAIAFRRAAAGVLALLTIIPGPDMAVVTRRALVGGPADALRTGAGIVCGLLVWGSLAVLGLTALLIAFPTPYLVLKLAGVAAPNSAATWLAAVAVLSTVPAKPAAGEQVIRPRQGNAGWPVSAALSE